MILDEKAIEKQLEDSMPSNRWYPKISDIKAVAHAQARAICTAIEEADQSGSTPRQSRIAILRLIRQLEAELRGGERMVEKNKILLSEVRDAKVWYPELPDQRDSDHSYYATPEGAGYQQIRREIVEGFVKWLKEPCLHRDGSFPDPIHVPPEARLPRFKCRDCIDSLLKSPPVEEKP